MRERGGQNPHRLFHPSTCSQSQESGTLSRNPIVGAATTVPQDPIACRLEPGVAARHPVQLGSAPAPRGKCIFPSHQATSKSVSPQATSFKQEASPGAGLCLPVAPSLL